MKKIMFHLKSVAIFMTVLLFVGCSSNSEEFKDPVSPTSPELQRPSPKVKTYKADLHMLNDSGVMGTAELTLMDNELTVHISAIGLVPDRTHAQHIHGFTANNGNATCPGESADVDGNGMISLAEGLPFYGPVLQALTPFSTAPEGAIEFEATYILPSPDPVSPLQNRVVVLHGLFEDGVYNGSLPVACGQIMPDQGN